MRRPVIIKTRRESIAENVIAVGDPERTSLLAELLDEPKVVCRNRGYTVVTGEYKGMLVTIATHGIGCPSASMVFEELAMYGVKRIVRLGTAGGLKKEMKRGSVVVATASAYACNSCCTSMYAPGSCMPAAPHPLLTASIINMLREKKIKTWIGPVYTSDAFYAEDPGFARKWAERGVIAVEMESAILFTLGWMKGIETAGVFVISNNLVTSEQEVLSTRELAQVFLKVAEAVLEALNIYSREGG